METQTFDLSGPARKRCWVIWFRRGVAAFLVLATAYGLATNYRLLANDWVYQLVAPVVALATAAFTWEAFYVSRMPPQKVEIDPDGLTYSFSSGSTLRLPFHGREGTLEFRDVRGTDIAVKTPNRALYFVEALFPPFSMRRYPLTPEAFVAILQAAKKAGFRTVPPDWGPVVPGEWRVTLRPST